MTDNNNETETTGTNVVAVQQVVHQTDQYNVAVNPAKYRDVWVGTDGKEFIDNYLIINVQYNTIEYRAQDLVNALSVAEHMQHVLSNKEYLYNDPFAAMKQAMGAGQVIPFAGAPAPEDIEDGETVDDNEGGDQLN